MDNLTETQQRALKILAKPMSCTELGERLWATERRGKNRVSVRQSYARPAGKIILRLSHLELVHICQTRGRYNPTRYKAAATKQKETPK